jgi:hypothetical protein
MYQKKSREKASTDSTSGSTKNILLFRIVIMIHFNIIIIMFLHTSIVVNCKQPKMRPPLLLLIATLLALQKRDTTLLGCRDVEQYSIRSGSHTLQKILYWYRVRGLKDKALLLP